MGIGLNFTRLDPIAALYWSAVINGVLAAPVIFILMLLVRESKAMGRFVIGAWLRMALLAGLDFDWKPARLFPACV